MLLNPRSEFYNKNLIPWVCFSNKVGHTISQINTAAVLFHFVGWVIGECFKICLSGISCVTLSVFQNKMVI